MIFVLVSPLLYCLEKWGAWILMVIYLLQGIVCASDDDRFHLFMRYTFTLGGLSFFYLGMVMRGRGWTFEAGNKKNCVIAFLIGITVLCLSLLIPDVESRSFLICRMIFVPMFLFSLWNLLPTIKLPSWLSSMSFPIFILHILVWRLFGIVESVTHTKSFSFLRPEDMFDWGVKWAIGFCGPILFALSFRKIFPRFARVAFGGR